MGLNNLKITIPQEFDPTSYNKFINDLLKLRDTKYLEFNKKITFSKYEMIGIRTPMLRSIAKDIKNSDMIGFLKCTKRKYFEEILLEGFVISYIRDYDDFLDYFYKFLPFVDNWAVCDMCVSSMKIIGRNKDKFIKEIKLLLNNDFEYYVRVGIVCLMDYYIEEDRLNDIFTYLDSINRSEYYIEMAMAWLISICYIKHPVKTEEYLKNNKLSASVINKAIQKIRDSRRVSISNKDRLLQYKK